MGAAYSHPGYALIFRHKKFHLLGSRDGNEIDVEELENVLQSLGFSVKTFHDNCKEDVLKTIEHYSEREDLRDFGCLVVIVLTHGGKAGVLWAADGEYNTKDVWQPFIHCRSLQNKPKIFLFQAYRGETEETRFPINAEVQPEPKISEEMSVSVLPHKPDFLLIHSTVEENVSQRDHNSGKVYISILCRELQKAIVKPVNIFKLLTRVNKYVTIYSDQTATFTSFLNSPILVRSSNQDQPSTSRQSQSSNDAQGSTQTKSSKKYQMASFILYTSNFKREAKLMKSRLEHLPRSKIMLYANMDDHKLQDLNQQMNSISMISDEILSSADTLLFVVIGQQFEQRTTDYCEILYVKTKGAMVPINAICGNFTAAQCRWLREKPKLFFFCDPHRHEQTQGGGEGLIARLLSANKTREVLPPTDPQNFTLQHTASASSFPQDRFALAQCTDSDMVGQVPPTSESVTNQSDFLRAHFYGKVDPSNSPPTTDNQETNSSNQDHHDQHVQASHSGNVSTSTNITDASNRSTFSPTNSVGAFVNSNINVINNNVQMPTGGSTANFFRIPLEPPVYPYPLTTHGAHSVDRPEQRAVNQRRLLALIISNDAGFENSKYEDRKGNERDVNRLKDTLNCFGFTSREFYNKEKNIILDALKTFTNEDHKDLECVMVIVLTHGNYGGLLCAKDEDYHTRDVWKPFLESAALKNIPKIFIFQACRGTAMEVRCYSASNVSPEDVVFPLAVPVLPQNPGFLLAHSSIADHKSIRNEETGTIFIQAFCNQLETVALHGKTTDIFSILTEVNNTVTIAAEANGTSQTSTFTSFLHQPFCLKGEKEPKQQTASSSHTQHDAASGGRKTTYDKKGKRIVLILYTEKFENQVKTLQDALECQDYVIEEIRIDENLVSTLSDMTSGHKLESAGSLTVFVLAEMTETSFNGCEKMYVKTLTHKLPLTAIWSPFTASKCWHLRSKPKLFFFCDLLRRTDGDEKTTTENVCYEPVNNHSDFLWTYCYGKKMFDSLMAAMFVPQEEITHMLTTAMRKAGCSSASGKISHFESTLRLQFFFQ